MSWINGDRKLPEFPTRAEKISVPLWFVLVGVAFRLAGRGLLAACRHRVAVAVVIGLAVFYRYFGGLGLAVLLPGLVVACLVWRRVHRRSFLVVAGWVRRQVRLVAVYRWRWRNTMVHTGLAIRVPVSNGERVRFADYAPRIRKICTVGVVESLRVELLPGQTPEQWAEQAEALRHAFRARSCRVRSDGRPGFVWLDLMFTDPLAELVAPADLDGPDATGDLGGLPVGLREDGRAWLLPVRGTHVLVAGATGSGKGSVLWSTIRGLGPWVRAGLVKLWVADPKGGMELAAGQTMFTRFATNLGDIADLLDDAVSLMQDRAGRLRGVTRLHTPTVGEPLVVVVVDEIASLTAYVMDRELKKRLTASLPLLLSQGRAPGVVVLAAVQDPRKDVLPFRDLFPVRVALRMTEAEQVDLVLGGGARDRGARCDEIPDTLPGVGFVAADGQAEPVRVRAAWVDDAEIDRTAGVFRPPLAGDVLDPDPEPGPEAWTPDVDGFDDLGEAA
jgi:S-DNA-T family DNA segregation ATPase FtsK/SpoIIIE